MSKRITGLRYGGLPHKIAQLAIGESLIIECTRHQQGGIRDRVGLANKAKSISHMQWECTRLHCLDMNDPNNETFAVKVKRVEDKE